MDTIKDLNFYKNNCEEDYVKTPISVLRYITELEQALQLLQPDVSSQVDKANISQVQNDLNPYSPTANWIKPNR